MWPQLNFVVYSPKSSLSKPAFRDLKDNFFFVLFFLSERQITPDFEFQ